MTGQNRTPELTPRQRKSITALLTCPTVEEAARAARVSRSRLYIWLQDKIFSSALEAARREQSKEALDFLRSCLLGAAQKLDNLLGSGNEAVVHRAAVSLLDFGFKAAEMTDLQARVKALEEREEA